MASFYEDYLNNKKTFTTNVRTGNTETWASNQKKAVVQNTMDAINRSQSKAVYYLNNGAGDEDEPYSRANTEIGNIKKYLNTLTGLKSWIDEDTLPTATYEKLVEQVTSNYNKLTSAYEQLRLSAGGRFYNKRNSGYDGSVSSEEYTKLIQEAEDQLSWYKKNNETVLLNSKAVLSGADPFEVYGGRYDSEISDTKKKLEDLKSANYAAANVEKYSNLYLNDDYKELSAIAGITTGDTTYKYINNLDGQRDKWVYDKNIVNRYDKYDYMTDSEIQDYNYIYNTQGETAANDYLAYLSYTLNERRAQNVGEKAAAITEEHPLLATGARAWNSLMSGKGLVNVAGQKIANTIREATGGEYRPVDYNRGAMDNAIVTKAITDTTSEALNKKSGTIQLDSVEHPFLARNLNGKGLGDLYQLGMSMYDSAVVMGLSLIPGVGAGGAALLGGASGTQGMIDALERGASDSQALSMGILNGAAEMVFEKVSIDNLLKGNAKNLVLSVLRQSAVEGSEELFTTIANTFGDILVMGDKSEFETKSAYYMSLGMTEKEAEKQALMDVAFQLGYDFLGGAISGGVFGAGGYGGRKLADTVQQNAWYENVYGGAEADLVAESLDIDPENAYAQKMQARLDEGNSLTGGQLKKLVQQNEAGMAAQDMADIQGAATARLAELGETGDVHAIGAALAKQAAGESLTKAEKQVIAGSKYGQRVANELNAENIRSGEYASKWAQNIGTSRINAEEYNAILDAAGVTEESGEAMTFTAAENAAESTVRRASAAAENGYTSSGDGKTLLKRDGSEVEIEKVENLSGGVMTLRLTNGNTVNANDVEFATEGEAFLYDAVASLDVSPKVANNLISTWQDNPDGVSASQYALGVVDSFRYGSNNMPKSQLENSQFASKLTALQRNNAYVLGQHFSGKQVATAEAIARRGRIANKFKTASSVTSYGGGKVVLEGVDESTFTERQKASVSALETVAEALGVSFRLFESDVDAAGNRIGANGWYVPGKGEIHIDVKAGSQGQDTILFTASHELTHFVKDWSPAKFKKLSNFLMQEYGESDVTVEELVQRQIEKAKRNGRDIDYDTAFEEVVADSMETMLADGNVVEKLAKLKTEDRSLWEKIRDFIRDLAEKIKKVYAGLTPDSAEGRYVAEMKDKLEEFQNLFTEGLAAAGENFQAAAEMGIAIDAETESVAPIPMMSERTWSESEYVTARDGAAKEIAEAIGVSVKKAKAYIDDINSIAAMIAADRTRLDYFSSPGRSSFVGNVEYGGSFDFSTLCKKRLLLTGTFTAIQKALPNTALTADEILDIRNRMKNAGLEVNCGMCYVEGSRAKMGEFSKEFLRLYKEYYPDAWQPNMVDVNTPDGVEAMRLEHPEAYEQYEYFWNHYGKLRESDPNLFASQQKPKLYQLHTEYNGEILKKFKGEDIEDIIEDKNRNGGIRMQSFSDFEIVHLIDMMQIIMDMSRVGLAGQAYTKVPDFAWALGDTGLKINLSLVAKDVDENGRLIFDGVEGMDIDTAMALRDRYSKNVGTIVVVFTDKQLTAAMADERVDFIIPFHRSQWKKSQYAAMGLPANTKDYTYQQNEKYIKPQYHEYRGRMVKDKATNYMPNEYWDFSKSGKENAEAYLEMCARNNKRPKFYKLLTDNRDGSYSLKADGSTDGYWKLLIDFKMYDNDGIGSPQTEVRPAFNMEEARRMLNEYKGGHQQFPVARGIVDEFVSEYKATHKPQDGVMYSLREVDPIQPSTDAWKRTLTTPEAKTRFPTLWDVAAEESDVRNPTQISSTVKSYRKIYNFLQNEGFDGTILDASSGLGYGTRAGIEEYGFDVEDIEPYPDKSYKPKYTDYSKLEKKYDVIISNAVLNVLPQDQRDALVVKMGELLNDGGRIFINVRGKDVDTLASTKTNVNISPMEWFVGSTGSYQKGFTKPELVAYLQDAFGSGYRVNPTSMFGAVSAVVTKEKTNALYSERETESLSNRSLLANAFEGLAQNDVEKAKMAEYKANISAINEQERILHETNAEIRKLSFGTGTRDQARLRALRDEATKAANRIDTYDRKLLRLEASKPLQNVLERAKDKAYKKAKAEGKKALEAYREKAEARQQEISERYRESKKKTTERRKENEAIRKYRDRIKADVDELTEWVLHPNNKSITKHVPDVLKTTVLDFLDTIDFSSKRSLRGGDATKADQQFIKRMQAVRDAIKNSAQGEDLYSGYLDLPEGFTDTLQEFIDTAQNIVNTGEGEYVINQMTSGQLQELSKIVRSLKTFIKQMNVFHANAMYQHVYEAADETIDSLGRMQDAGKNANGVHDFLYWKNIRPAYAFERFGKGGEAIYDGLRRGQAQLAFNSREIIDFAEATYTAKEVKSWEEKTIEISLGSGESIRMPVANIMSLYKLKDRPQALRHILGEGVRVATYKAGKEVVRDVGHKLTEGDVDRMVAALTPRQKQVADKLQQFMAQRGGEWGNHVSVARFGEKLFGEKDYFPIHSDGRHLQADAGDAMEAASLYRLLNMSFTKEVNEKANNRLVLYSIFDVFANHMSSMAQYNAMALPVLDALKWFNYRQKDPVTGEKLNSVRDEMNRVYGAPVEDSVGRGKQGYAEHFVANVLKAFNGTEAQGSANDSIGLKLLSGYNKAAVAANLRVVIQQPTAIIRAGLLVDMKNIAKGLGHSAVSVRKNIEEMQKYSGVAAWKDLGFYDVNISRGVTDMIKHKTKASDWITEKGLWLAEKADKVTWSAIWNACKIEVRQKQGIRLSDPGFYEATAKLFEDVIYKTQVVDSVLTKSEYMRDKGFWARMTSSFMSEPVTTASMVFNAADKYSADIQRGLSRQEAWKKNGKLIARTAYVYALGGVINATAQAVADAFRDDDDYEKWLEKFMAAFRENLWGEMNLLDNIPVVADAYESLVYGVSYAVNKAFGTDMYANIPQLPLAQMGEQLSKATEIFTDKISGKDTNYTVYGGVYKMLQFLSGLTGLPAASLTREVITIWNNTVGALTPGKKVKTYELEPKAEIKYAFQDGFLTEEEATAELLAKDLVDDANEAYFTIREWEAGDGYSRYGRIYDAVRNDGDFEAAMEELTSHGYAEKDVISQVKSEIGKWYKEGTVTKDEASRMLLAYTDMDDEDIDDTVAEWTCVVETGIAYDNLKEAFMNGEITKQEAITYRARYGGYATSEATQDVSEWAFEKDYGFAYSERIDQFKAGNLSASELLKVTQSIGGKDEDDAKTSLSGYIRDGYEEGAFSRSEAYTMLTNNAGLTADNAELKLTYIDVKKQYPNVELNESWVSAYYAEIESSGIDLGVYLNYRTQVKDITGTGKKERRMAVIDSLPISSSQKTALYYSEGWAASRLYEAPWA